MKVLKALAAYAALTGVAIAQPMQPAPAVPPIAPQGAAVESLLPALVETSRHTARLENGRLVGEGADLLRALGAQSQFVMIGEEHGVEGIANFAAAYWRHLQEQGFNYAAVEVDPWTAAAMERELRSGGVPAWGQFLAAHGGSIVAPFFNWSAEAAFAETIVTTSAARGAPAIWGLDQVFLGSAPWLMRDAANSIRDPQARTMAGALADAAEANPMRWLGTSDPQGLIDLRARLNGRRDRNTAALIDAMILSQTIYRPFTADTGEAWIANVTRENLMKRLFVENYRAAERADGAPPRVMLKFGGYHAYRGTTPTNAQGLGGFVTEFATLNGASALTIYTICGPGSETASFDGSSQSCTQNFSENWSFLAPYVNPGEIAIFDLRVWKQRGRRWAHLPADTRRVIESFDVLVVISGSAPAALLSGLTPPSPQSD